MYKIYGQAEEVEWASKLGGIIYLDAASLSNLYLIITTLQLNWTEQRPLKDFPEKTEVFQILKMHGLSHKRKTVENKKEQPTIFMPSRDVMKTHEVIILIIMTRIIII